MEYQGSASIIIGFNGKRIMEGPIDLLLKNPQIDIKFFINWANENWTRAWDGLDSEILLTQKHSLEDDLAFIEAYIEIFHR